MNESNKGVGCLTKIITFLIIFTIGILIGLYGFEPMIKMYERYGAVISGIVLVCGLIFATVLSTVIHEGGHLVFGLISGYRFVSFRIFSFVWVKTDDGIKLKRYSIPGTSGQCLLSPPELNDGKMPTILYNLGGCIAGIVFAVLFTIAAALLYDNCILFSAFLLLALCNLLMALMNGIPMKMQVNNDGMNALSIGKNAEAIYSFWLQLSVNERQSRGERLCEMPDEWFYMPSDQALKNSMVASNAYIYCMRLIEERNFDAARDSIEHLLSVNAALMDLHKVILYFELLYIASINGDKISADRIFNVELNKHKSLMANNLSAMRSRYAYESLIREDKAAAYKLRKKIDKMTAKLKNHMFAREVIFEEELIERVDTISDQSGEYTTY